MRFEWMKGIDIFGKQIEFKIQGRDSFRSLPGALISVIYGMSMIVVTALTFQNYFRTDRPGLVGESYQRQLYPKIDLLKSKMLPFFIGYSTEIDLISPEQMDRYFTFTVEKIIWKSSSVGGVARLEKEISYHSAVPCGQLSLQEREALYGHIERDTPLAKRVWSHGICIPANDEMHVAGKGSDPEQLIVSFKAKPCSLAAGCATLAELQSVNFQWVLPATSIDASHFHRPKKTTANADLLYYINPKLRQIYSARLKESIILDSTGLFDIDWKVNTRFFDVADITVTQAYRSLDSLSCLERDVRQDSADCFSYFEFNFMSSGIVSNYKRFYKTFGEVLGEIGGINGLVVAFFVVIVTPFVEWKYNRYILNQVYCFLRGPQADSIFSKRPSAVQEKFGVHENAAEGPVRSRGSRLHSQATGETGGGGSGGRCCRKKDPSAFSQVDFEAEAIELTNSNFDIINILRDLNTVKVLARLFLKDRHLKLAQLVQFKQLHDDHAARRLRPNRCWPFFTGHREEQPVDVKPHLEEIAAFAPADELEQDRKVVDHLERVSDKYFKDVIFGDPPGPEATPPAELMTLKAKQAPPHKSSSVTLVLPDEEERTNGPGTLANQHSAVGAKPQFAPPQLFIRKRRPAYNKITPKS